MLTFATPPSKDRIRSDTIAGTFETLSEETKSRPPPRLSFLSRDFDQWLTAEQVHG